MSARQAWRAEQLAKLDALLDADNYRELSEEMNANARLAARNLHEGDVDAAREWAALAIAADERIDTLFARRKARDADEARALGGAA